MSTSENSSSANDQKNKVRIDYIDGIRGLAALAVVSLHLFEVFGLNLEWAGIITDARLTGSGLDRLISIFKSITGYGAYAVEVFMVVSGYCLMLAIARSENGEPNGGRRGYFLRRVRRIFPPYYAALFLSLFLIAVVPGMNVRQNIWWDQVLPAFTPGVILSHLFFFQHLSPDWLQKINPTLWTVAVQNSLYLLFPFILLPIWRRYSGWLMALCGIVIGVIAWYVFFPILQVANPWYLGLFAIGAFGASISFSKRPQEQHWREKVSWLWVSISAFIVFALLDLATKQGMTNRLGFDVAASAPWLIDTCLGISVAAMLIRLTEMWKVQATQGKRDMLHLFEHPLLIKLGAFSYSLYLVHAPLVAMVGLVAIRLNLTSWYAYAFVVGVGIPVCMSAAYLFHLVLERRFQPSYLAKPQEAHQNRDCHSYVHGEANNVSSG